MFTVSANGISTTDCSRGFPPREDGKYPGIHVCTRRYAYLSNQGWSLGPDTLDGGGILGSRRSGPSPFVGRTLVSRP